MPVLAPILAIAGVQASATAAAWLLRTREQALKRQLPYLVSLAVGVLISTALLHLLPEAITALGNTPRACALLGAAMLFLFTTERLFFVLTGKDPEPELTQSPPHHHRHSTKPLNLILASMLHSLVDGTAVAVAFLTSPRIGWLTALAVALHEIPHRMGDFAVLVHLHVPVPRALRLAALAGIPSFLGVAAILTLGRQSAACVAYLLPLSAGSFLYIATVNLLPELQHECRMPRVLLQLASLATGIALVLAVGTLG